MRARWATHPTLSRLERTEVGATSATRYAKIEMVGERVDDLLADAFVEAMACVLTCALRRIGLAGTEMARAQANTIRLRLLRIGALVRITTRKIWVSMSASWPWQELFQC